MKKQYTLSKVVTIVIVAVAVTFTLTMMISSRIFDNTVRSVKEKEAMYSKIAEIDQLVRQNYYGDIDETNLLNMLATGYVSGLGTGNNRYYRADQFAELQTRREGNNVGVGIDVVKDATSNYIKIIKVYDGSAAVEAGITTDHYIVRIDDYDVRTLTVETVRNLLQGEAGTAVNVTVLQDGQETTISVLRSAYNAPTVTSTLVDGIGYVKINTFNAKTEAELDFEIRQLIDQGAQGFVFDVRYNTSTNIDYAMRCADLICPEGTMMSAVYKDETEKVLYTSDANSVDMPMVVLVNASSSSAAEVFTVALRDMNEARVVGERTVGRGTYQQQYRLTDGSAIELTVALLKPSVSDFFNGVGLIPDYESSLSEEDAAIYYELTIDRDTQVQRSFEVLNALIRNTTVDDVVPVTSESNSENAEESSAEENSEEDSDEDSSEE